MLRLAVATDAETYERMGDPLAARDVAVEYVQTTERAVELSESPWSAFDVGFVYPPRLMEGGVADAHLNVPWVNGRDAILRSRNKAEVLARLGRAGVPVPETVMVSNPVDEADPEAVYERFDPPVVVKPNSATRGVGVARAADLDSFLGVVDYLGLVHDFRATGDRSFLVQSFLSDATDYRVMVLDGAYVGAVERHLPADAASEWKHNVHRGAVARPVDLDSDLRDLAERAAGVLDIPFVGVDVLVTDDRAVVTETNARPTIDDAEKYEEGFWDNLAGLIRQTARTSGARTR
jgi:ribosomal protein S6--L-glutamate ligase